MSKSVAPVTPVARPVAAPGERRLSRGRQRGELHAAPEQPGGRERRQSAVVLNKG
jgi:hypothetical protein